MGFLLSPGEAVFPRCQFAPVKIGYLWRRVASGVSRWLPFAVPGGLASAAGTRAYGDPGPSVNRVLGSPAAPAPETTGAVPDVSSRQWNEQALMGVY